VVAPAAAVVTPAVTPPADCRCAISLQHVEGRGRQQAHRTRTTINGYQKLATATG
jgi:hypothetical protein